jgi:hypothetical protein
LIILYIERDINKQIQKQSEEFKMNLTFKEQHAANQIKDEKLNELDMAIENAIEKAYEAFGFEGEMSEFDEYSSPLRDLLEELREFQENK